MTYAIILFVFCIMVGFYHSRVRRLQALANGLDTEKGYHVQERGAQRRKLGIAIMALSDIATQGDTDAHFKIWAKKRAVDTLDQLERHS